MILHAPFVLAALVLMIIAYYISKHFARMHATIYRNTFRKDAQDTFWHEVDERIKQHQSTAVKTNEWVFKTLLASFIALLFPAYISTWIIVAALVAITPVFCWSIYVSQYAATVKEVLHTTHRPR
ncbi:MAG TPA: hypothetical protein VFT64_04695 [Rickettsiales bacterium]|nr:hypothetical protein [Rickettsiales bacterium]